MPLALNFGLTKLSTCIGLTLADGKVAIIVDASEDAAVDPGEWDALCVTYGLTDDTHYDYHDCGNIGIYIFTEVK